MALFGNDRSVMPSFRTTPELDSSDSSPYDDLNRLDRSVERNLERAISRNDDRRNDRRPERDDRQPERQPERQQLDRTDLARSDSNFDRGYEPVTIPVEAPAPVARPIAERPHLLIEGLFSKLPQPDTQWPLQARQKWLQTAANIFDLMYIPDQAEAGELSIRLERNTPR
jgi:hypothetical protein